MNSLKLWSCHIHPMLKATKVSTFLSKCLLLWMILKARQKSPLQPLSLIQIPTRQSFCNSLSLPGMLRPQDFCTCHRQQFLRGLRGESQGNMPSPLKLWPPILLPSGDLPATHSGQVVLGHLPSSVSSLQAPSPLESTWASFRMSLPYQELICD